MDMDLFKIYCYIYLAACGSDAKPDISMEKKMHQGLDYGRPPPHNRAPSPPYQPNEGKNYKFAYSIKDDYTYNQQSREEKKYGNTVTGQYTVVEPTGNLRVVNYIADDYGFRAEVRNHGRNNHAGPIHIPHPKHLPILRYNNNHRHPLPTSRAQTYLRQPPSPLLPVRTLLPPSKPLYPANKQLNRRPQFQKRVSPPQMKMHNSAYAQFGVPQALISGSPGTPSPANRLMRNQQYNYMPYQLVKNVG